MDHHLARRSGPTCFRGRAGITRRARLRGILIGTGPAFKRGAVIPPVENVHLYAMMCRILGLTPAPNDGSADALDALLSSQQ